MVQDCKTRVRITFYNRKLLLTVDLNQLFESVLRLVPEALISFEEMSVDEKADSTDRTHQIHVVQDRVHIYRETERGFERDPQLEQTVEAASPL